MKNGISSARRRDSIELNGPHVKRLAKTVKGCKSLVILGVSERHDGALFNSILYFDGDGQLAGAHRKLMPTYTERLL